ncbi:MAG: alpha/beta hydrolase-fold protein [Pseudohongiellaceae bacterium]|nr:alpha/beta hydrolase-fold protein [Pseudohongiellaceae bacterium]
MLHCRLFVRVCFSLLLSLPAWAGTVTHHSFNSPSLGRSIDYNLYTPDGYESSSQRYPVLFLLHGNLGTEHSWIERGGLKETADKLIASGQIPAQLIVTPRDPNFWWSDSELEPVFTAMMTEFIPHIDDEHRTLATASARAIGGYSAGGFGAANAALRYPQLFSVAALLSPAIYGDEPPETSSGRTTPVFMDGGEFSRKKWQAASYTTWLSVYKESGNIVPFYINSGDHDRFDIAFHAAVFFQALREHQPEAVELRIFDGDHDFAAWGGSLEDAMIYMANFLAPPMP